MHVVLTPPEQHWVCSQCNETAVTRGESNRYHSCRGLAGILAPMMLDGQGFNIRALVREDYIGDENVHYDGEGRPIMAVSVDHGDGSNDLMVNAPAARGGASVCSCGHGVCAGAQVANASGGVS